MNPALIEELSRRIGALLPDSLRKDVESSLHGIVQDTLGKMNLVTREEFEIQAALLQRTREKLDRLEKTLAELEQSRADAPFSDGGDSV